MAELNQPKVTGLDMIVSTLTRGSSGEQVKALQQYLNGIGYDVGKIDSIFGPKTEAAVRQFQLDNGLKSDGMFGPKSTGVAKTLASTNMTAGAPGTGKAPDDSSFMFNTETGKINPNFKPTTQEELDTYYRSAGLSHPIFQGNTPEALENAVQTGNFSGLVDTNGQPFSQQVFDEEYAKAEEALSPGFEAGMRKAEGDVESTLGRSMLDYNRGLALDRENFESDKAALDKNAADSGVLFSGSRYEKQKKLEDAYRSAGDYNREVMAGNVGNTLRDYQYQYGDQAVNKPSLSKYFQLGGNTYNANVARGGTGESSLSKIYSPEKYNFQGTVPVSNKTAITTDTMRRLANRGNKLLSTGYQNSF